MGGDGAFGVRVDGVGEQLVVEIGLDHGDGQDVGREGQGVERDAQAVDAECSAGEAVVHGGEQFGVRVVDRTAGAVVFVVAEQLLGVLALDVAPE